MERRTPTGLVAPTIHLNGSSRQSFEDGYRAVLESLIVAKEKLADISPHGRDYYVQSADAVQAAIAQNRARIARIDSIMVEIEDLWEDLNKQGGGTDEHRTACSRS